MVIAIRTFFGLKHSHPFFDMAMKCRLKDRPRFEIRVGLPFINGLLESSTSPIGAFAALPGFFVKPLSFVPAFNNDIAFIPKGRYQVIK